MPNGNLLVAWQRDTTVTSALSWAVYDPTGQLITNIDQPFVGYVTDKEPTVAALTNETGVIVWKHFENAAETWHLQRVDALGQPIGSASVLPLDGALDVQVTGLAAGGFLLSWETATSDPSASQLLAQAYDANGHVAGGVMQIDPAVHMESAMASFRGLDSYDILATADGGFLLVSEDAQGGTGVDVDVQEFDAQAAGQIEVHGGVTAMPVGDYTVTGTTSLDTIVFGSAHTAYSVAKVDAGATVTGPEGHDLLLGVERIRFGDNFGMAFDVDAHAGQAWRLYQAAFDRQPDLPGLGYQMSALDIGLGLSQVAAHFIASPEFQTRYGSVDNSAFVTLLYQNVLDRNPEDAGLQYHLADLAAGLSRADVLTHFSESPENQANVIGQIESGMLYMFG